MMVGAPTQQRRFVFERDTFAYANELVWEYRVDPVTGQTSTCPTVPPPQYAHRCFVMVRSARQFFYHARFEPGLPVAEPEVYRRLIRQVVGRSALQPSPETGRIVIPGYESLRAFSQAQGALLKTECGGVWQSYCLRSHWRMIFPISRQNQARTAQRLVRWLEEGTDAIVHLVRFPQLTINHGITLFGAETTGSGLRFEAYDPNQPGQATELSYDSERRRFCLPRNHYWAGGWVNVIQIYRSWFF